MLSFHGNPRTNIFEAIDETNSQLNCTEISEVILGIDLVPVLLWKCNCSGYMFTKIYYLS